MRKLIYSMMMSLDGFIERPPLGGGRNDPNLLDWVIIDEELHSFANEEAREAGAFLYGRRLYQNMAAFWPTADRLPDTPGYVVDFARIWKPKPKIVFSRTLDNVEWNSRLVSGNVAEEVVRLKAEVGGYLTVGGARLATTLIDLDLIDEYRLIVHPVVIGGGTPLFPPVRHDIKMRLLETRTFSSGVVFLRYEAERGLLNRPEDPPAEKQRSARTSEPRR
ncbi:MAG TPA: dihydrofolate reductase family protein [Candidatus Micrarchaeaceae archaeon]|nr:dihydrofolate reductase family protein [Candidatus Micrarchaeaceae archaeon]